MSDPNLRLPFDQYQRYRLVADILEELRPEGQRLTILDVGGRTALLRAFLPDDTVHLVDVEGSEQTGLVLGDGSRLPFTDGAVDAVVAFDTLEHVPRQGRSAFLDEALRVAGRWTIIAGPYDTEGVAEAEELLTRFVHGKMNTNHRYLEEHASNGLPSLDESVGRLARGGARVATVGHANLKRWLALMCAELYMDRDPQLRALAADYYEFYNASLYASDHAGPVYRHALVAAKGEAPLPEAEGLLGPSGAPESVFEPVAALVRQLVEFDVQREVVKREWDRLEGVNADLQLDLEGHRETLGLVREEVGEQRKVIEEQRQRIIDTVGHIEELELELEDRAAGLAAVQEHEAELEASVHSALAALAEVREEHAAAERAVENLEETRVTLEGTLDELNLELAERQKLIDNAAALEAGLRRQLEEAASVLEEQDLAAAARLDEARRELESQIEFVRREFADAQDAARALEALLAGERAVRAAETLEREALVEARVNLEADLEALHRELGRKQAELDTTLGERDSAQGNAKDLEALVAEVRAEAERSVHAANVALAEKQAELDATLGERDSARGNAQELEALVAEVRADAEAQVHAGNVALGEKQGELDRALAEVAALRATLRDRKANLKRTLSRKRFGDDDAAP